MSDIIEKLNQQMKRTIERETWYNRILEEQKSGVGTEKAAEDALEKYEQCLKDNKTLTVVFSVGDAEGNLSCQDEDGILLVLKASTFQKTTPYYSAAISSRYIGSEVMVNVDSVDRQAKVVYLRSGFSPYSKMRQVNSALLKRLEDNKAKPVEEREKIVVFGRVSSVGKEHIMVNILDQNIKGILYRRDWGYYTGSLRNAVSVGDTMQFIIRGKKKSRRGDYGTMWVLSRKGIAENPWSSFPADITEESIVIVKCVQIPEGKSYWWGRCDRVPNIDVMCNFNERIPIVLGEYYECRVRVVRPEVKQFKVSPFNRLTERKGDSVHIIEKKARKKRHELEQAAMQEEMAGTVETELTDIEEAAEDVLVEAVEEAREEAPVKKKRTTTRKTTKKAEESKS